MTNRVDELLAEVSKIQTSCEHAWDQIVEPVLCVSLVAGVYVGLLYGPLGKELGGGRPVGNAGRLEGRGC